MALNQQHRGVHHQQAALRSSLTSIFVQTFLDTVQSTCAMATWSSSAYASPSSFHVGACTCHVSLLMMFTTSAAPIVCLSVLLISIPTPVSLLHSPAAYSVLPPEQQAIVSALLSSRTPAWMQQCTGCSAQCDWTAMQATHRTRVRTVSQGISCHLPPACSQRHHDTMHMRRRGSGNMNFPPCRVKVRRPSLTYRCLKCVIRQVDDVLQCMGKMIKAFACRW